MDYVDQKKKHLIKWFNQSIMLNHNKSYTSYNSYTN